MSRELRNLQEDQKNSLAFGGTAAATATTSSSRRGYSESVKENMKILLPPSASSSPLPSAAGGVKKATTEVGGGDDGMDDDDDDTYVPLVTESKKSSRHHHHRYRDENHDRGGGSRRRHEDNHLSSPPPPAAAAPVGRRTTRNSSTTSPLEDSKKECRIVLTSSRRSNIPSSKTNGLDSDDDSQSETEVESDDENEMKAKKKKSPYRSSPKKVDVDDEEADDVDYNGEDEVVDDDSDAESHGEDSSTDDDETYKILRSSRAASLTYPDDNDGRRRSTRPRHILRGSYHDTTLSWVVGGGGEAKGYFRPSSLTCTPRRLVATRSSSGGGGGDCVGGTNGSVVATRSRSQESKVTINVQNDLEVSSTEENGHVGATDDGDTNDDMYSRVKKRRVVTRSRSKTSSVVVGGKKKNSQIEEEPVCRRLRDRNKLSLSRNSGHAYESEAPLDKILRKNRRHKRRRGEKMSNSSSSSSSSSTDSDDTQIKSPSKKKRKFGGGTSGGGEGVDNLLRGHGLVAKKELKMLMEVQPIAVDPSITFKSVGGLDTFIDKLKEIVLFPLLYHEFYEGRGMSAPKGILLHGPPGTGKTLLARALSNECANINGRKVSFFLRKGADLLNKFVGESERQLRMLFQQAALHQPSIIFFDEIDGLAPVRSAKSDQIHNSIVSSLLAEIDGLQDRGQIIVMGSTNRLDFVDPALRRPGRFDCELPIFLPTRNGRRDILAVHVSKWKDPPQVELLDDLADRSVGFNGADLKFLCWQATMNSLRRTYPQIYGSSQKYLLNYDSIKMDREDWEDALASISPSTQRSLFSTYSPAQPLPAFVQPLLRKQLHRAVEFLEGLFPHDSPSLLAESSVKRILLQAEGESGLNTFIVPALLHLLEKVPVYVLSFEALHMDGGNVEFCVTQKCMEVMKQPKPCICYLPDLERLCDLLSDASKEIMIRMMAQSLTKPILFLATVEGELDQSAAENCDLLGLFVNYVVRLPRPSATTIQLFFQPVFELATKVKRVVEAESRELEQLALAPPEDAPAAPKWTKEQLEAIEKRENSTFRELRIFLRQILTKLARNKKFEEFTCPVDIEEVPDYLEVIERPMDFEAMMYKLNSNAYYTGKQFLDDIDLIYTNCLAYNPHRTESDKRLRLRAYELKDFAEKLIEDEMDSDFERECHKIIKARVKRNQAANGGNVNPESSSNGQGLGVGELAHVSSSSTNAVTPSTSTTRNNNRADPSTSSASRPTSARTKRRKSSAWSKGTVPKKKGKRPNSSSARNLEDTKFSQIVIEEEDDDEDEEVDVVGDDDDDNDNATAMMISPTAGGTTEESSSASTPGKLRAVPRLSQSSSSSSAPSPPESSGGGNVPNSSASQDAATSSNSCDNNFYLCNNSATWRPKFDHLLTKTVHQCQNISVVKLIDLRFQVLRLVTKHLSSPDKTALYTEMKAWLKKISPSLAPSASPASTPFVTTTTTTTPSSLRRPFNVATAGKSGSNLVVENGPKVVAPPASSAPARLRFTGLERRQQQRRSSGTSNTKD